MNTTVTEFDIESLASEVAICKDAGLKEIFFKFEQSQGMVQMNIDRAFDLLVVLQSLMTSEVVHLSVDIEPYIIGIAWMRD